MAAAEARRDAKLRFGNPSVWRERMSEIDRLLPISNSEEKDGLLMEKTRLRDQLATLGGRWWKNFR